MPLEPDSSDIQLTPGAAKKLQNLVDLKDMTIAQAIRLRGGGQSQVEQIRTDYRSLKVGELANRAATKDLEAEKAIKILKQARKKYEKYN